MGGRFHKHVGVPFVTGLSASIHTCCTHQYSIAELGSSDQGAAARARPACVQIVRSTIIEHDKDKDGYLNYQEFKALLSREDLNSNVLP